MGARPLTGSAASAEAALPPMVARRRGAGPACVAALCVFVDDALGGADGLVAVLAGRVAVAATVAVVEAAVCPVVAEG